MDQVNFKHVFLKITIQRTILLYENNVYFPFRTIFYYILLLNYVTLIH